MSRRKLPVVYFTFKSLQGSKIYISAVPLLVKRAFDKQFMFDSSSSLPTLVRGTEYDVEFIERDAYILYSEYICNTTDQ